jgi:hypothetical protein
MERLTWAGEYRDTGTAWPAAAMSTNAWAWPTAIAEDTYWFSPRPTKGSSTATASGCQMEIIFRTWECSW